MKMGGVRGVSKRQPKPSGARFRFASSLSVPIATKSRLGAIDALRCSGCIRHTVHDLEQLRIFSPSVYRCSNCHVATVPCSTCQHATRFKTRTSERLGGFGGTGGRYGADAVGGRSGGGGVGVKGAGEERGEETKVTNLKQCLACSSGKEWSELERNHREQVEMSNAAHSHEALLPTQQAKLVSRLEAFGEIRTYRKGEVLIQQGSAERQLMVMLKGSVVVQTTRAGNKADSPILAILGPGCTIGDIVFLKGGTATATVRSMDNDVSALLLPRSRVLDQSLQDEHGGATADVVAFYRFLAGHLADKLRRLNNESSALLSPVKGSAHKFAGRYGSPEIARCEESPTSSSLKVLSTVVDQDVCTMFNIHASEYLTIQLQPAALIHHGKRPLWGKVCATQSYVCFRGDLFGQPTRFAFHFSTIEQISDIDQGCRAYLELSVRPEDADDDEQDSCFLFLFACPEGRDLFGFDLREVHSQQHVWKQSRGKRRASYRVQHDEAAIFTPVAGLDRLEQANSNRKRGQEYRVLKREHSQTKAQTSDSDSEHFNFGMARLVEGARAMTFDKDDVIIHEGNRDQRLYQIGPCSSLTESVSFTLRPSSPSPSPVSTSTNLCIWAAADSVRDWICARREGILI
eukprot:Tamp_03940.p1 GENE.Tamp_03940~~Tamp_03940.p1  ORF type:complete len:631 (+),score=47.12 Tamp_03940:537-2429(+)